MLRDLGSGETEDEDNSDDEAMEVDSGKVDKKSPMKENDLGKKKSPVKESDDVAKKSTAKDGDSKKTPEKDVASSKMSPVKEGGSGKKKGEDKPKSAEKKKTPTK